MSMEILLLCSKRVAVQHYFSCRGCAVFWVDSEWNFQVRAQRRRKLFCWVQNWVADRLSFLVEFVSNWMSTEVTLFSSDRVMVRSFFIFFYYYSYYCRVLVGLNMHSNVTFRIVRVSTDGYYFVVFGLSSDSLEFLFGFGSGYC